MNYRKKPQDNKLLIIKMQAHKKRKREKSEKWRISKNSSIRIEKNQQQQDEEKRENGSIFELLQFNFCDF